jgi:hypothetical protein
VLKGFKIEEPALAQSCCEDGSSGSAFLVALVVVWNAEGEGCRRGTAAFGGRTFNSPGGSVREPPGLDRTGPSMHPCLA